MKTNTYDVVIVGGSYAGLSAAMALGRAMRKVLLIDSGLPCNRQTPHSHNFLTRDGEQPQVISAKALSQVMDYPTVQFHKGIAIEGHQVNSAFRIMTEAGEVFESGKLVFATGVKDIMPDIDGFSDCWGKSVIHCPYCHGYEMRHQRTAILANGDFAFHYAQLIYNWTKDLTVLTNGKSTLTNEQAANISKHGIQVIEKEIKALLHESGQVRQVAFKDGSIFEPEAVYSRPAFEQHCAIPTQMTCEFTEAGLIKTDMFQQTNIPGIFACGDNCSPMRSVANAVATGNFAGAMINNLMTEEEFKVV
jgi:thioredoxin reductase